MSDIARLIAITKLALAPRGKRADLARFCGVRPLVVSRWLAGTGIEGGNVLAILRWLRREDEAAFQLFWIAKTDGGDSKAKRKKV